MQPRWVAQAFCFVWRRNGAERLDSEGEIALAAEKTVELPFVERECAVGKFEKSVFNILFVAGGVDFRKDFSQHGAAFVGGPHEATELSAEHLGVLVDLALLCHGFGLHLAQREVARQDVVHRTGGALQVLVQLFVAFFGAYFFDDGARLLGIFGFGKFLAAGLDDGLCLESRFGSLVLQLCLQLAERTLALSGHRYLVELIGYGGFEQALVEGGLRDLAGEAEQADDVAQARGDFGRVDRCLAIGTAYLQTHAVHFRLEFELLFFYDGKFFAISLDLAAVFLVLRFHLAISLV